jgi:putative transposase
MKKRFTEEQIGFALHQVESGTAVAEIIRKLGGSE